MNKEELNETLEMSKEQLNEVLTIEDALKEFTNTELEQGVTIEWNYDGETWIAFTDHFRAAERDYFSTSKTPFGGDQTHHFAERFELAWYLKENKQAKSDYYATLPTN